MKKYTNYIKITLYSNGKLDLEELNETNFHPSNVNEIRYCISDKLDYCSLISDEKNLEKNKQKIVKHNLRKIEKKLSVLKKQYDCYKKTIDKLNNQK